MIQPPDSERRSWSRFASHYEADTITPFRHATKFRLPRDLKAQLRDWNDQSRDSERYLAVDFGCGTGDSLIELLRRIPAKLNARVQVVGLDYARGMLKRCADRLGSGRVEIPIWWRRASERLSEAWRAERRLPSPLLIQGDLLALGALSRSVDLALSVNAICPSRAEEAQPMLTNILRTVRRGGRAFVVVPAFEATEHLFQLADRRGCDLSSLGQLREDGLFEYAEGEVQKYLSRDEIESAAKEAKIEIESLERIPYGWGAMRAMGWGYFPGEEKLWDWYLVASRH